MERTHGRDLDGAEAAKLFGEFVNVLSNDHNEEFIEQLTKYEHKTIQGAAFRLMLHTIIAWSQLEDSRVDPRNEHVRSMAREIVDLLGGRMPPLI